MPGSESDTCLSHAVRDLEAALQISADVEREILAPGLANIWVHPKNHRARAIWFSVTADEVIVEAGEHGGRWELSGSPEDVALLDQLVRSVMAGRIRELVGPGRSTVEVTLADGTVVRETGHTSLLPRPGWRRRAKVVAYEPYDA